MINLIWAESTNKVIGINNKLPWYLPEDLQHFKQLTNNNTVIMGRSTWDSLPDKFKPLPNRHNIVVSKFITEIPNVEVSNDLNATLLKYKNSPENVWVIGGSKVYEQALQYAKRVIITHVHCLVEGDAYAPKLPFNFVLDNTSELMTSTTGLKYEFKTYIQP